MVRFFIIFICVNYTCFAQTSDTKDIPDILAEMKVPVLQNPGKIVDGNFKIVETWFKAIQDNKTSIEEHEAAMNEQAKQCTAAAPGTDSYYDCYKAVYSAFLLDAMTERFVKDIDTAVKQLKDEHKTLPDIQKVIEFEKEAVKRGESAKQVAGTVPEQFFTANGKQMDLSALIAGSIKAMEKYNQEKTNEASEISSPLLKKAEEGLKKAPSSTLAESIGYKVESQTAPVKNALAAYANSEKLFGVLGGKRGTDASQENAEKNGIPRSSAGATGSEEKDKKSKLPNIVPAPSGNAGTGGGGSGGGISSGGGGMQMPFGSRSYSGDNDYWGNKYGNKYRGKGDSPVFSTSKPAATGFQRDLYVSPKANKSSWDNIGNESPSRTQTKGNSAYVPAEHKVKTTPYYNSGEPPKAPSENDKQRYWEELKKIARDSHFTRNQSEQSGRDMELFGIIQFRYKQKIESGEPFPVDEAKGEESLINTRY